MITNNATLDQAMRALSMAVMDHRSKTGLDYNPASFELRVHPDTWLDWSRQANDLHPAISAAIFERESLMGFKIVRDSATPLGRLVMRCIWEMTVL